MRRKKRLLSVIFFMLIFVGLAYVELHERPETVEKINPKGLIENAVGIAVKAELQVERLLSGNDQDSDGIDDLDDIVQGARQDAENRSTYKDAYYRGGYPPENEGVCTDVVWRAFKNAGYVLKDMVDRDIKNRTSDYKRVRESGGPDPNIDFRRIPNLVVFFDKYAEKHTIEVIPGDAENLKQWQGGDIVVFGGRIKHIAVISDKRNPEGVPYILHNAGPYAVEEDALLYWNGISQITQHYRWVKQN